MSRDAAVLPSSQRKRADHSPGEGPSGPIVRNAVRFSRMASVSLRGINPAFIRRPTQGHSRRNPVFSFWGLCPLPRRALSEDGGILPPRDGSPLLPCKISVPRRRKKSKSFLLPAASPRLTGNGKHDTLNPWNRNFPGGVFRHRVSIHDGGSAG